MTCYISADMMPSSLSLHLTPIHPIIAKLTVVVCWAYWLVIGPMLQITSSCNMHIALQYVLSGDVSTCAQAT